MAVERQVAKLMADFHIVFYVVYERFYTIHNADLCSGFCSVPTLTDMRSCATVCEPDAFPLPDTNDGYFVITGDTLTPLQAVDRTAIDVFMQLARFRSGASLASNGRTPAWVVTVNHYGAHLKAERVMQVELGCVPFFIGCETHKFAHFG